MKNRIILAITGASGSLYAEAFAKIMGELDVEVHGIISDAGRQVMALELDTKPESLAGITKWYDVHDFTAAVASGSGRFSGMVVLPCTMGTLGAIANGICGNLIHRAADVMLKERRPLVLTVRETPLNRTHLENMLKVQAAGAIICPAMPAFYHRPGTLADLAQAFAGRVAEQLGFTVPGLKAWGE